MNQLRNFSKLRCELDKVPPSIEGITDAFNSVIAPKPEAHVFFAEVMNEMIEKRRSGERLTGKGTQIADSTIRKYTIALQHLENFEERYGDITLDMLTKSLGETIISYFNSLGLAHNTTSTSLKQYITAYNYGIEQGYLERGTFHKARIEDETADTIALTEKEINAIYNLNLSENVELEEVRDIFIVGVWTLLRFGDYSVLRSYQIKEKHIELIVQKTQERIIVPLHWQVKRILAKYNNQLPPSPTQQNFNAKLKKIAKMVGMGRMEEIRVNRGGKVSSKLKPRWEMVTTHTARRTGATYLYRLNIPKKIIMLLTGHQKEINFDKYIKIDKLEAVEIISDLKHFQEPLPSNASDFEDGFYWTVLRQTKTIAKIKDGVINTLDHEEKVGLETWFALGGKIIERVKEPA